MPTNLSLRSRNNIPHSPEIFEKPKSSLLFTTRASQENDFSSRVAYRFTNFLVDELDFYTFETRQNNKKNLCEIKKLDDPMVYSFAIRLVEREIAISS